MSDPVYGMLGLSCMLANCGTLHSMTPPPNGADFRTEAEYVAAREKWERQQCWQAYVTP